MQTIYRPGQWYLMVIPGALVALPPDVPGDILAGLWERLPGAKTLATVVDVLTSHAGGSFTALPPFVAAVAEGSDLRIALRGRVVAKISSAAGAVELTGAEVTTWNERFIAGASKVEITVEETGSGSVLTVTSGLVLASAVSADLEPSDAEQLPSTVGPTPVIVSASMGVSAAALASAPAPLLAAFPVPGLPASVPGSDQDDAGGAVEADAAADVDSVGSVASADAEPVAGDAEPTGGSSSLVASAPLDVDPVEPEESSVRDDSANAEPPADVVAPAEAAPAPLGTASEDDAASESPESGDDSADSAAEPAPPVIDGVTLFPTEMTLSPSADDDFDQLWGSTVHSASAVPAPPAVDTPVELPGDHDGATISAAELRALRQQPPAVADEVATAVLPVTAAAPGGRIRVSTGQVVALDRTVIIGRRPRSTRASGANLPHLVAVESPQQDISRSHLEIRPEGDTVVVIDLHTTNGSTLLRPGADPLRLHPGEQTLVLSGDVVDLGDGVTVAFEDLP
ncbi:FHA domain-containing protein [Microbacterium aurantiacum]|uniref:FHA domain-containing protein n=1 Tax=Microbacterium aurantiacum TaxID=162393 RepID=UPI000C8025BD|nr:FHA domain-containing protein [Microbacterium aurantiacum]